jgi:RND family efflux transporter MFP subunit
MAVIKRQSPNRAALSSVVAAALLVSACEREQVAAPEPVRPVKAMRAEEKATTRSVTYSGSVKARREATLGFRVAGKIVERLVNAGERVAPGTVLARLDRSDLALSLASASAALAAAKTQLAVAQSAYDRASSLAAKGFAAQATLDERKLALDQARSVVDQARSAHEQAANQANYAELKSDVAGVVTSVQAEAGQVVAAGAPVVVVARDGEKEVAVAVPENEIRHFHVGDSFSVRFWADPDLIRSGTAREIAGSADPTSRTFAVRISLPDDPAIRLGETAAVTAEISVEAAGIEAPLSALAERNGRSIVWIVDPGSKTVSPREIVAGGFSSEGVRIVQGLAPGELVVTAGAQFMTPGKSVLLTPDDVAVSDTLKPAGVH